VQKITGESGYGHRPLTARFSADNFPPNARS
jgi:hypothetical protein